MDDAIKTINKKMVNFQRFLGKLDRLRTLDGSQFKL